MARFAFLVAYDGTNYKGWQKQPDESTIQGALEEALAELFETEILTYGSGRTDAGVHATGQVMHADLDTSHSGMNNLQMRINSLTPDDIHVQAVTQTADDFHARFHAQERTYRYHLHLRPSPLKRLYSWYVKKELDPSLLKDLSKELTGIHSFSQFSKSNDQLLSAECTVLRSGWIASEDGDLYYEITANRFLHHMVRMLVGTMVKVASGDLSKEAFMKMLHEEETGAHAHKAPACGLVLREVKYEGLKADDL